MPESPDVQPLPPTQPKPVPPINISDIAVVASNMNRFLSWLAAMAPFKEGDIGIAEWLVLMTVAGTKEANSYNLGWLLGFPGPRVLRMIEMLINSKLLATAGTNDKLGADAIIVLTDTGRTCLEKFNAELWPLIETAFTKKENKLVTVIKYVPILGRVGAT